MTKKKKQYPYDEYYCHGLNMTLDCECGDSDVEVRLDRGENFDTFQCSRCKKEYFVHIEVEMLMSEKK